MMACGFSRQMRPWLGATTLMPSGGQLLHGALDEEAEAADDVGVVAEALALEEGVLLGVVLVVEDPFAQLAVAAEGVAREERAGLGLEGHHGLGPVDVGRLLELQRHAAQVEGVAGLDRPEAVVDLVEALDQLHALGRAR